MELIDPAMGEQEALAHIKGLAQKNKVNRSFIGMGYHETNTPGVILRNMLENPGWYTAYTPYQAEIAQGRLEMLLNFQTMVADLTGLPLANASLLDEATAAAEGMAMCYSLANQKKKSFFVSDKVHPQTIDLMKTRGEAMNMTVVIGDLDNMPSLDGFCGVLVQYPDTEGTVEDFRNLSETVHAAGALVVAATDLLALTVLSPPGEWGADIAIGSAQRFGVPFGFGGPHAAFLAVATDKYSRKMPGRIIGVSIDVEGNPALRMAMQTREQHIRRDKATSNICTAQALLANMAAAYGVYHGPEGLTAMATRIRTLALAFAEGANMAGCSTSGKTFFDTVTVQLPGANAREVQAACAAQNMNIRVVDDITVSVSFGEKATAADVSALLQAFGLPAGEADDVCALYTQAETSEATALPEGVDRAKGGMADFMTHPVFNSYHSESQMLRYLKSLENKDLSLNHSMISLGSCTMKLNATSEMIPVTWSEFGDIHPFAPVDQTAGYLDMIDRLNADLCTVTGFAAMSAQPNSGAQGEYAGLLCIKQVWN
jgi:glycine dehydrogenase